MCNCFRVSFKGCYFKLVRELQIDKTTVLQICSFLFSFFSSPSQTLELFLLLSFLASNTKLNFTVFVYNFLVFICFAAVCFISV